jgi:hypothetical protein
MGTRCALSNEVMESPGNALLSSRPCPTCCIDRAVPGTVRRWSGTRVDFRTFGKVTFGMMTVFNAEGASFLGALGSPPGWYWYLPSPPPDSHGLLFAAWLTLRSEEALVGDRAATVSHARLKMDFRGMARRSGKLTKVPPSNAKDAAHDG